MRDPQIQIIHTVLDHFEIETPSWGYADTGTRFGKFFQAAAAIDVGDKLADAGQVHRVTGCCPSVALHILWDFHDQTDPDQVANLAAAQNIRIGSMNPNVFQDQQYRLGSFGNPDGEVRDQALKHCIESVKIGQHLESRYVTLWFADGTNYPGQDSIRSRKQRFCENLKKCHQQLAENQILLIEYKPFEPAFYQTDIADWGMAYILAKQAGAQARVLVDTGHHYLAQNVEQIVAWLLDENMLGGFHFNDRRYADDDLTLGSIDPYQIFRIFAEIHGFAFDRTGQYPTIAYMIDQSHNLKPKIESMIQTVTFAQELYAKAALIDFAALWKHREAGHIMDAEREYQDAFATDVRPAIASWRQSRGLNPDPLAAHRESGYELTVTKDRSRRRQKLGISQSTSYA